jgi:hypothetical protein
MSIVIGGNTMSGNFSNLGVIQNTPTVVTDGLVLWLDAGNNASYINSSNYYDCGYGCQYYSSSPGCTNCNTQWKDMSGNGADGVFTNGAAISYATGNGGILFNGSNSTVEVSQNFGVLSNYTICYWAKRDSENRMPIAGRTSTAFYWYGDNSWFYTHGGATGEYYYSKPTSIPLSTWGHYCVVYNGSNVTIYRQGVYQGQQSTTGTADWSQGMKIGYWSAGGGYAFNGTISVVNFYNRALTSDEILQNYNNGRLRFGL